MIAVVMTYYQRQALLNSTLESFKQYDPSEFFVVIVDDDSPDDIVLPELEYDVEIIKLKNKTWHNAGNVYNRGFIEAFKWLPDIVIIQNAECIHWGDILGYAKESLTDENYIAFPAYSLGEGETPNLDVINNRANEYDGDSAWYNHATYRPTCFHFCAAITTKNLKKLNGFDERFAEGVAYEDNMFVHQIKCLGLRIDIPDAPMVFHQWHYNQPGHPDLGALVQRNRDLLTELSQSKEYRAVHTLTPDL